MAGRPFATRLRVDALLEVAAPLHVGGLGTDPDVDLPVAVNGKSQLYVPGTSLAGVFRAWMIGNGKVDRLDQLWGYARDVEGTASRVFVRDGLVLGPDRTNPLPLARLESRTSVGIDRFTGTAARRYLFSRATVPVGSFVRIELDLESTEATTALDRSRLGALLGALAAGEVSVGAASTRGLGRVRLVEDARVEEHNFASPEGLVALLRGQPRLLGLEELAGDSDLVGREKIEVTVTWTPRTPVMVRADRDGVALDTLPLTGAVGDKAVRFVMPGSSIKGAIRSHAERLVRTVSGQRAPGRPPARPPSPAAVDVGESLRAQLSQLPLVTALCGAAPEPTGVRRPAASTFVVPRDPREPVEEIVAEGESSGRADLAAVDDSSAGGVGALAVADCYSQADIDESTWRAVVTSTALEPEQRTWLRQSGVAQADHVAIDRWTGGAADKLLFTVAEPWRVGWEPIRLTVDLTRLGDQRDTATALLMLVLRDLQDGRLQLGGGVNRGFGDVDAAVTVMVDSVSTDLGDYLSGPTGSRIIAAWRRQCAAWREAA